MLTVQRYRACRIWLECCCFTWTLFLPLFALPTCFKIIFSLPSSRWTLNRFSLYVVRTNVVEDLETHSSVWASVCEAPSSASSPLWKAWNFPRALSSRLVQALYSSSVFYENRFFTIFTKSMPLEIASRVWDCFFLEGELFLFQTALGLPHAWSICPHCIQRYWRFLKMLC